MPIRALPQAVINRIAAGEVLERPASALKEIIENAIDAGATSLRIDIERGGKNLLRVRDNGSGIAREELSLAITRHCTSKLEGDDLLHIDSFGFRGEALSSIGSVARLSIASMSGHAADAAGAWILRCEGGEESAPAPTSHPQGTTVEVRDLFYATPARLKFLKSDKTEQQHCIDAVKKPAMAYPFITFSMTIDGRNSLSYDATCTAQAWHSATSEERERHLRARLTDVLGKMAVENMHPLDAQRGDVELYGFASLPTFSRATADHVHFFINNRPVRDRFLLHGLRAAYNDVLARDKHPVTALFLEMPPQMVDVNVHPAKSEVRFRYPQDMRSLVVGALGGMIRSHSGRTSGMIGQVGVEMLKQGLESRPAPSSISPAMGWYSPSGSQTRGTQYQRNLNLSSQAPLHISPLPHQQEEERQEGDTPPLGYARAQIARTYIIAQAEHNMVIVDQHAAHERVVYEQMKQDIAREIGEKGSIARQSLLSPHVVDMAESDAELVLTAAGELARYGLIIERFGISAVSVREIPAIMAGKMDIDAFMQQIIAAMKEDEHSNILRDKIMHIAATSACHGSIRAGRQMNISEMNALLRQIEQTPRSGQCNHGRPTYIEISLRDIEHLFERA